MFRSFPQNNHGEDLDTRIKECRRKDSLVGREIILATPGEVTGEWKNIEEKYAPDPSMKRRFFAAVSEVGVLDTYDAGMVLYVLQLASLAVSVNPVKDGLVDAVVRLAETLAQSTRWVKQPSFVHIQQAAGAAVRDYFSNPAEYIETIINAVGSVHH